MALSVTPAALPAAAPTAPNPSPHTPGGGGLGTRRLTIYECSVNVNSRSWPKASFVSRVLGADSLYSQGPLALGGRGRGVRGPGIRT